MVDYTVSSGQVSTGTTLSYTMPGYTYVLGDTQEILSGGKSVGTLVDNFATETVSTGGAASGTTVNGGTFLVGAGATADRTVVLTDLTGNPAYASYNYGGLDVHGVVTNTTVSGGTAVIEVDGSASGIVVASTGFNTYPYQPNAAYGLRVLGAASGVVLTGSESVSGATQGTTINAKGSENVAASGVATGTTVNTGGVSTIYGTAKSTTISGGSQTINQGAVANATTINQGGSQTISGGGSANGATVNGGGTEVNLGAVVGLTLNGGGTLANSGSVSQGAGGIGVAVAVTSGATITNIGTISATGYGVFSDAGAAVALTNSGTIQTSNAVGVAVDLNGGGTITNSGTIIGGSTGQAITGVSHLTLTPGQVIQGGVQGASGSTLELAGSNGTLAGLGSQYAGFATVQLDQGQAWTLAGPGSLGGGATLALGAGSTLVAAGALTDAAGGTIAFQGTSVLSLAASPTGLVVTGFAALDRIDLPGLAYAGTDTVTKAGSVVTVSEANGTAVAITIAGAAGENFALNSVAGGGSVLTVKPVIASLAAHADAAGILGVGNVVTFDLTPNVALAIDTTAGVPTLGLSDGGTATYDATASSSSTLVFRTTVAAGQNTGDLKVGSIAFGNATIVDQVGSPLDLTSVGTLAGSDTGIAIVTTPPSAPDTTAPNAPTGLALDPASDSGVAGDGITNVASATINGSAEAGSTVRLYDGGTTAVGTGIASGTGLFSIAAAMAAGANTLTATATDAAGNVSGASATLALTLDTTLPTATAIAATPSASGALGTGATVTFTLTPSAAVSLDLTQGSPTLGLSDGGTATYAAAASTGTALVFQDTVLAGQGSANLLVTGLSLGGATITDAAGNALDVSTVPPLAGSSTGLVVDTSPAAGVTTAPGAKGGTVFTTVARASNSVTATAAGSDVVNSLGSDTVQAGGGFDIVYASGPAATVLGGAGNLVFVAGGGNYTAGGGAGVDILYGGNGADVLTAGAGKGGIIVAGFGNTSLVGGAGSATLMFGGFGASSFAGSAGGADTMVGGTGANTFAMTGGAIAFGGLNGPDTYDTGSGSTLIVEGAGRSQINVGTGLTTDFAGTGIDTYTITRGSLGVADIVGFKAGDHITLAGGFTAADAAGAVSTATTGSFGTTLHLSDGTRVNLFGVSVTTMQVSAG
ncbi:MAG: beta strand repeat-containing protein [Janthinobacterium lividum]